MTYEQILQRTPSSTSAGDLDAAAGFVRFLTSIIEGDRTTFTQLSGSQQRYLYRLRGKWQERASGDDQRWNEQGLTPGRPAKKQKATRKSRRKDPGESTPLFLSLMRKYGKPHDEMEN